VTPPLHRWSPPDKSSSSTERGPPTLKVKPNINININIMATQPLTTAVKMDGRKGRHEQFINGPYEPTETMHNNRPVWVARSAQACYLFHTGKTRWVISKRLDDGSRCYAYTEDTGNNPAQGKGQWVCCDSDGQWRIDPNVHCVPALASNDKFVQLRLSLDEELAKYGLTTKDGLRQIWKTLDVNGNNIVSLAEIDKLIVEMVRGGQWPAWLNNKPALMRAYKKTTMRGDNGDDWVHKGELADLMLNIFWFNKLFQIFNEAAGDRRLDVNEFQQGIAALGLQLSPQEAQQEFRKMDTNGGGQVLFVEFCAYVRNRICPDHDKSFDADFVSGEMCHKVIRKSHGNRGTHTHYVDKKALVDFNNLEAKIKTIMADNGKLRDLWHQIDFNGNNIVSLAEIDKLVVESFPLLNHKPALMRAYKATIKDGNGDDWVQKHEFKSLLGNLFYFNKLFWLFEEVDGDLDRRMTMGEFQKLMTFTGASQNMSAADLRNTFQSIDKNHGGYILFDEFCAYFTTKACPECLQAFTG